MRLKAINIRKGLSIALFASMSIALSASRPTVKMSTDSTAMLMGYTIDLHLTVNDENASDKSMFIIQPDSVATSQGNSDNVLVITPGVEIVNGYESPKIQREGNGEKGNILKSIIKIQSFDSGDYIIPPILYTNGHDTVLSNSVALRVFPIDTITTDSDLKPINSILPNYDRKLVDYLPDWLIDYWIYIVIALVIIAGGICAYLLLTKKITLNIIPQKKPEPPYNVAIAKLEQLREEQLCEQGLQKEYYTRLTDILREYLDRRFNINAMEMTSTQIRQALNNSKDEIMSKQLVEQVLEIADFVKFAKAQPLGDDNIRAFEAARCFVEDTKPVEPDAENQGENNSNANSANNELTK